MAKPRLTDDSILTGADGFAPTPRRHLEPVSPFFDESDGLKPAKQQVNDFESNTSSSSSSDDDGVDESEADNHLEISKALANSHKPANVQKLIDVDLGGADPAPSMYSPAAGSRVPISPFLDDEDFKVLGKKQATSEDKRAEPLANKFATQKSVSKPVISLTGVGHTRSPKKTEPSLSRTPAKGDAQKRSWSSTLREDAAVIRLPGSNSPSRSPPRSRPMPFKIDLTKAEPKPSPQTSLASESVPKQDMGEASESVRKLAMGEASESVRKLAMGEEWASELRDLQSRARRAEKRLAFTLMESATRRRKEKIIRNYFNRWRTATASTMSASTDDDATALANELLQRLRDLRGQYN